MDTYTDKGFMRQALRLAKKGQGRTSPNPMVGALLVKAGKIVGRGYHHAAGQAHAEVLALAEAGEDAKGATLYTTLEPCCHRDKRTPPCTDAILKSGVSAVVSAMEDPNVKVAGKGFLALEKAGLKLTSGVLEEEAFVLNEVFVKNMRRHLPFVTLKAAMTLDGRIATASGESKWISGPKARKQVDQMRARHDAVMVGIGTVIADDPMLILRSVKGNNPTRIVIDPKLRIGMDAKLVRTTSTAKTLILTTQKANSDKIQALEGLGVRVQLLSDEGGQISFEAILQSLWRQKLCSVLIEGGAGLNGIALRSGYVDRIVFYISPKFLCGTDALAVVSGKAIANLSDAIQIEDLKVRICGDDIRVEGRPKPLFQAPDQEEEAHDAIH